MKIYDEEKYALIESFVLPPRGFDPGHRGDVAILREAMSIALLKLKKPLQFNKFTQPACLATEVRDEVYEGALKVGSVLSIAAYTTKVLCKRQCPFESHFSITISFFKRLRSQALGSRVSRYAIEQNWATPEKLLDT